MRWWPWHYATPEVSEDLINELVELHPWADEIVITDVWMFNKGDIVAVRKQLEDATALREREGIEIPTIRTIAPFLRSDVYMVPLEGSFDREGRPLVYIHGCPRGNLHEMLAQFIYVLRRTHAMRKGRPDVHGPLFLYRLREDDISALRTLRHVCDLVRVMYPSSEPKMVMLEVPRALKYSTRLFRLLTLPINRKLADSMIFSSSLSDLSRVIDEANCPALAGWTLNWDMEEYIKTRAAAEGVEVTDEIRQVGLEAHAAAWHRPDDKHLVISGVLQKQGRGGFLRSSGWKVKYVELYDNCLAYYDNATREACNNSTAVEPECVIDLGTHSSCTVVRDGDAFILKTPVREYRFKPSTEENLLSWLDKFAVHTATTHETTTDDVVEESTPLS